MLTHFLSRLYRPAVPTRPARKPRARLLDLEALEARDVPAVIYGLTETNSLFRFDSATPAVVSTPVAITGLGVGEILRGIDFRPRTGQLIGSTVVGSVFSNAIVRTYRINPTTGVANLIGATAAPLPEAGDVDTGYDFNPTVDRIRYINDNDENARLNPNTGLLAGNDTDLTSVAPATGDDIAAAYDRNTDRQNATFLRTTLYVIDENENLLGVQGGIDGAGPGGPNAGVITAIGALGFNVSSGADASFDIAETLDTTTNNNGNGTAFAAFSNGTTTSLYTINLTTGAATLVGLIGTGGPLNGMAVAPEGVVVVGSGTGANGDVRLFDPTTGALRIGIVPFAGFQGGVRVAAGDVNGDGVPDAVATAVAAQGHVKVFDGISGAEIRSFFAFAGFQGTVNVSTGDVNGDGFADILVAANGAPGGHVKAFSGRDGTELASFFAYEGFFGNVTVSAADFDNDGDKEIVTAAASNGHVKVFSGTGTAFASALLPTFVNSFFAFDGFGTGDVNVASGDINGDGISDIAVSSGAGTQGHVRAFNGSNQAVLASFFAFAGSTTGAAIGLADSNGDGLLDIRVTPGSGVDASVTTFDLAGTSLGTFTTFAGFRGGSTVAGARF